MLRDVEGWEPEEVSAALELTPGNQRVLLHRARSKVRNELEGYLDGVGGMSGPIVPGRHQLPRAGRARHRLPRRRARAGGDGADGGAPELCAPAPPTSSRSARRRGWRRSRRRSWSCDPTATRCCAPSGISGGEPRFAIAKEIRRGSDDGSKCPEPRTSRTASPRSPRWSARARRPRRSPTWPAASRRRRGRAGTMPFATDSAFVALIESVAAATAKADTIDEAMLACVEHVCRWTGWPVGHVYIAGKSEHDPLQPSRIWYLGHPTQVRAVPRRSPSARRCPPASAFRAASPRPAAPPGSSTSPATRTSRAPRPAPRSASAAPSPSRSRSATRPTPSSSASRCRPSRPTTACSRSPRTSAASSAARSPASSSATPCASPRAASARSPSPRPTRSSPPTRTATSSPGTAAPS